MIGAAPFYNDFMRQLLHLPVQGTEMAQEVDNLHFFIAVTTMVVAQPAGRRCLPQVTLASCAAGVAPRRLARFYHEALTGDADAIARAAAEASTSCEREVYGAL